MSDESVVCSGWFLDVESLESWISQYRADNPWSVECVK